MNHSKRLLVILMIAGALFFLQLPNMSPAIGSIEKVTWKTFKDNAGLFTIEYPSKWEAKDASNPFGPLGAEFWYYGDTTSPMPDTYAMVGVVVSPNSEYLTLLEMTKNSLASSGIDFRLEQSIECDTYLINQVQDVVSSTYPHSPN